MAERCSLGEAHSPSTQGTGDSSIGLPNRNDLAAGRVEPPRSAPIYQKG
jgi:hypothetical protein